MLYHYYPLHDINKLVNNYDLEKITLYDLLNSNDTSLQPFKSLKNLNFVINEKKIWVSKVDTFNDGFEFISFVHIEYFINEHKKELAKNPDDEEANKKLTTLLEQQKNNPDFLYLYEILSETDNQKKYYGVYCFTPFPTNPIMWGYYASSYTGVCVEFRLNKELKNFVENSFNSSEKQIHFIQYDHGPSLIFGKISYESNPLIINSNSANYYQQHYEEKVPTDAKSKNMLRPADLMAIDCMLGKSSHWKHENEYRLIALGLEEDIPLDKLVTPETQQLLFEVNAVIFGLKTPAVIKELIQNSCNPQIKFYDTCIVPGKYELKLQET